MLTKSISGHHRLEYPPLARSMRRIPIFSEMSLHKSQAQRTESSSMVIAREVNSDPRGSLNLQNTVRVVVLSEEVNLTYNEYKRCSAQLPTFFLLLRVACLRAFTDDSEHNLNTFKRRCLIASRLVRSQQLSTGFLS